MTRERWQDNEKVKAARARFVGGANQRDALDALYSAISACVDASPSETTGGEVVGPLRKRWLADVEMLHLFAKHLDGQTIIGGTATVYDLGRCLRGIASTLTNRVTLETDPRSDHFIEVLTEVMGELRIARDSSKGSLAQQVAHELRLRSAPPAGATGGEVYREALVRVMAHTGRTGADGHTPSLDLANGLLDSIARIAGDALGSAFPVVPRVTVGDVALLRSLARGSQPPDGEYVDDTDREELEDLASRLEALALSYCVTRQPAREKFDTIMAEIPPECCVHGVPHTAAEACPECAASDESDPLFVLAFCEGAIRDAIGLEDGLDGVVGEGVLAMIRNARAHVASAPHAGDGVPRVSEKTLQRLRADVQYNEAINKCSDRDTSPHAKYMAEVLTAVEYAAALSYCATGQGER